MTRNARLVPRGGEDISAIHVNSRLTIGRSPDNDIVLDAADDISCYHASLEDQDGHYILSGNQNDKGTYINNREITCCQLFGGETIRFGSRAEFKFLVDEIPVPVAESRFRPAMLAMLLLVILIAGSTWYLSNSSAPVEPLAPLPSEQPFAYPEVITTGDYADMAKDHIIQGLQAYKEHNLEATREQFDVAIDIMLTTTDTGDQRGGRERSVLRQIRNHLPLLYGSFDLWRIYRETLQETVSLPIATDQERKAFARRELKKIMQTFRMDGYEIPVVFLARVDFYLDYFQNTNRGFMERSLLRSYKYYPMIKSVFKQYNLPEELAYMALIESGFNRFALSKAGARGLWQFMPLTAKDYGLRIDRSRSIDERTDPAKSTHAAAHYFKNLMMDFGTFMLAMASYNAGEGRVRKALHKLKDPFKERTFWHLVEHGSLQKETEEYVPKILAAMIIGKNPVIFGFPPTPDHNMQTKLGRRFSELKKPKPIKVFHN